MFKITALLTTLALGSSASIALASPGRSYARPGIADTRVARSPVELRGIVRIGRGPVEVRASARTGLAYRSTELARFERDRFDRPGLDRSWRGRVGFDDFGPRRYRPTWVALNAPQQLGRGEQCIEVRDPGTFTQLRLQSDSGFAGVNRVVVQFADGSDQVADLDAALDQRGELVELPLDGNNRRIARIIVVGATGDLQVFAI